MFLPTAVTLHASVPFVSSALKDAVHFARSGIQDCKIKRRGPARL